uniref:(California timema) hypothetical protein n=1 Tax=Timema californicum TaxID=61474 RepID=A0A7R9IZP7_TIMCA|nr:unnamed protein product [Timema californicum]
MEARKRERERARTMPGTNGTTGSPRVPVSVAPYRDRRASSSSDTSLPDTNLRQWRTKSKEPLHDMTRDAPHRAQV